MSELTRDLYSALLAWKGKKNRKPLLLSGARQVGKTYLARKLGKNFPNFIEVNFLENELFGNLFNTGNFDIENITKQLSNYFSIPVIDDQTLILFDEIQACPKAIEALRFFYEKRPELHILASGSLLEFALSEIASFGVGRVENLFLYPLSFREYLLANQQQGLLESINSLNIKTKNNELLHQATLQHYKNFLLIGGLPEAVTNYLNEENSINFCLASEIIENIITNYEDDFSKYAKKVPIARLREVWRSSALQAGKKFIHSHAFLDADSKSVQQALNLLVMAGLVYKVFHSDGNGIPLGGEIDLKKFKTLPLDTGLYLRLVGLRYSELALLNPTDLINKGALVEASCGLELLKYAKHSSRGELNYWHREGRNNNAEVDYLIEIEDQIIPVEVKSSGSGAMQSLKAFMEAKKNPIGVRISTDNLSLKDNILSIPLYAISALPRLVAEIK